MIVNPCLYFITVEFLDFSDRYEGLVGFRSRILSIDGVNNHVLQPFHRHVVQPYIYIHIFNMYYNHFTDM
jgi:hypothetical protein